MSQQSLTIDFLCDLATDSNRCKAISANGRLVDKLSCSALGSNLIIANSACVVFCKAIDSYGCTELKGMIYDKVYGMRKATPYQILLHSYLYSTDCYVDLFSLMDSNPEEWMKLTSLELCFFHLKPSKLLSNFIISSARDDSQSVQITAKLIAKKWALCIN